MLVANSNAPALNDFLWWSWFLAETFAEDLQAYRRQKQELHPLSDLQKLDIIECYLLAVYHAPVHEFEKAKTNFINRTPLIENQYRHFIGTTESFIKSPMLRNNNNQAQVRECLLRIKILLKILQRRFWLCP